MGSVNQVDSCVGRSYDLIIFDEAALADGRDAFNVALRPTLDKDNSKAIFISTPKGQEQLVCQFFDRGFNDEFAEWCSIRQHIRDNPRMSEFDIAEARKSMSEAEFRQEYRKQILIPMKDKFGTLITKHVSPTMRHWIPLIWMYLLVLTLVTVILLPFV